MKFNFANIELKHTFNLNKKIKLSSILSSYSYSVPQDYREALIDFYLISFIKGAGSPSNQKRNIKVTRSPRIMREDPDYEPSVDGAFKTLVSHWKNELLIILYLNITSEMSHMFHEGPGMLGLISSKEITFNDKHFIKKYKKSLDRIHSITDYNLSAITKDIYLKYVKDENPKTAGRFLAVETIETNRKKIVQLARKIFSDFDWENEYGGLAWANIADLWLKLNESDDYIQSSILIDLVFDTEHNSGTIFSKTKRHHKTKDTSSNWIEKILDFKSEVKNPWALFSRASSSMQTLASFALYREGYGSLQDYEESEEFKIDKYENLSQLIFHEKDENLFNIYIKHRNTTKINKTLVYQVFHSGNLNLNKYFFSVFKNNIKALNLEFTASDYNLFFEDGTNINAKILFILDNILTDGYIYSLTKSIFNQIYNNHKIDLTFYVKELVSRKISFIENDQAASYLIDAIIFSKQNEALLYIFENKIEFPQDAFYILKTYFLKTISGLGCNDDLVRMLLPFIARDKSTSVQEATMFVYNYIKNNNINSDCVKILETLVYHIYQENQNVDTNRYNLEQYDNTKQYKAPQNNNDYLQQNANRRHVMNWYKTSKVQEAPPRNNKYKGGFGDKLNVSDVDKNELIQGIKVEFEHMASDLKISDEEVKDFVESQLKKEKKEFPHQEALESAQDIAIDHLEEIKDYYSRLKKMEENA